ncbi:MAG TPA: M13 family metallopeptidase [Opitutaceae bacterium]|nr:M13 family metallopeptidase [Opitutaceae bacterium]
MNQTRRLFAFASLAAAACAPLPAAEELIPLEFNVNLMDRTVDPRVDFNAYANGGWLKSTEIPADKSRWGAFDMLGENNWRRVKALLEEAAANPGAAGSLRQKVGDFFATALDTAAIDAAGLRPIEAELARIARVASVEDLVRAAAVSHAHIGSPLCGTSVYADQRNNDVVILYLAQGGLSLPTRDYYFAPEHEKFRTAFVEHVAKMLELAGGAPAEAAAQAKVVFELERKMAESAKTPTELRDPIANYNKMSVDEAVAAMPGFPLKLFLAEIGIPADQREIIVSQPKFLAALGRLLTSEPLDSWKTYLRYHLLKNTAPHLAAPFENENFRFYGQTLNGTPQQEPRWQRAARSVDAYIGFAAGQLYVEKYYPPAVRARLEAMIQNMRDVLQERITKLDWMSDATKEKALAKLSTFRVQVGQPEKWRDYGALEVRRDSYFANVWRAAKFEQERQLAKFGKPFDRGEWLRTPQQVNAYYQPSAGQLVFLAGILQPPYFDPTMDDAVNYGAIVAVIGHEITHGFDDKGRLYDAKGNLADWWTPEDAQRFSARAQKLIDQYGSYEVLPGLKVNGALTLGENIADLGGTSIAYEALQRSLKGKERRLIDGLTPEQRFYVAWAQVWRTKFRDDALRRQVAAGPHSPGQVRAIGPLVNQQEFFDAFGIKEGDPMWRKPEDRAKIW